MSAWEGRAQILARLRCSPNVRFWPRLCDNAPDFDANGMAHPFGKAAVTTMPSKTNSAIKDILSAGFNVLSIEEGGCASISEMSARAGLTRSALDNYLKGKRGENDFPHPVYGLSTKSPQFQWPEVANWLYKHEKIEKRVVDVAVAAQTFDLQKVC